MAKDSELRAGEAASEEQINALSLNKVDSRDIRKINEMKVDVQEKIMQAGDIFTEKDRQRWLKKLDKADDTGIKEIETIAREIDREKSEINRLTEDFGIQVGKDKQYFGIDKKNRKHEADQWIEAFRKQPLETKREWLKGLESRIGELKEMYEKAKELAPNKMDKFSTLDRREKRNFMRELESVRENTAKFEKMIRQNAGHLSEEEMKTFKESFEDMTAQEQEKILGQFMEKEITPRIEMTLKFNEFPADYTNRYPNFSSLKKTDKQDALNRIEKALTEDYENQLFRNPLSKHLSLLSKLEAYQWFVQAPVKMRGQAIKMLESQMKAEEDMSVKFDKLLEGTSKGSEDGKKEEMKTDFYNSKYEKKKEMITMLEDKSGKSEKELKEHERMDTDYGKLLNGELDSKVISGKTMQREKERFNKLSLFEKQEAIRSFSEALAPRKQLKERFEKELPEEVKKANGDFHSLSHKGRLERFQALKKLQEKDTGTKEISNENRNLTPEEKQHLLELQLKATNAELNGNLHEAINCYEAVLAADPGNETAKKRAGIAKGKLEEKDNGGIEQTVKNELHGENSLKKRRDFTAMDKFARVAEMNDTYTERTKATDKVRHLSAKEAEIQKGLQKRHDMVLDKDGRAVKIMKVDAGKFDQVNDSEKFNLTETLRKKATDGNNSFMVNNFQMMNDGQAISGKEGMKKVEQARQKLEDTFTDRIMAGLKEKGKETDDRKKETIKQTLKRQEMTTDL